MNITVKKMMDRLEEKGLKIPALSKLLDIPKDRIYKWIQDGTNPKADDEAKLKAWLQGDELNDSNVIKEFRAAISVLTAEVASLRAEKSGESVQHMISQLQRSIQNLAKTL